MLFVFVVAYRDRIIKAVIPKGKRAKKKSIKFNHDSKVKMINFERFNSQRIMT